MANTFLIKDVYNIFGIGIVIAGNIESGSLMIGMTLKLEDIVMKIKSMEYNHKKYDSFSEKSDLSVALEPVNKSNSRFLGIFPVKGKKEARVINRYRGKLVQFD